MICRRNLESENDENGQMMYFPLLSCLLANTNLLSFKRFYSFFSELKKNDDFYMVMPHFIEPSSIKVAKVSQFEEDELRRHFQAI